MLRRFLHRRCLLGLRLATTAGTLYRAYVAFCAAESEPLMSQRWLGLRLRELGLKRANQGERRAKAWVGIGLRLVDGPQ